MTTRKTIRAIFLAVFAELCKRIDEILAAMQPFIDSYLTNNLDSTVMSNMKLYPALEALRRFCQEKNKDEPVEYDILNLVAGISLLKILLDKKSFINLNNWNYYYWIFNIIFLFEQYHRYNNLLSPSSFERMLCG